MKSCSAAGAKLVGHVPPHASSSELSLDGHFSALLCFVSCDIYDKGFCKNVRQWQTVAERPAIEAAAVRVRTSRFFVFRLESCKRGYVLGEVLCGPW